MLSNHKDNKLLGSLCNFNRLFSTITLFIEFGGKKTTQTSDHPNIEKSAPNTRLEALKWLKTTILLRRYRRGFNLKEVHRRVRIENTVVEVITPPCWGIINKTILLGVVVYIRPNHTMPLLDTGVRRLIIEQILCWTA